MNKITKGILIFFIFLMFIGLLSGSGDSDSENSSHAGSVTVDSTGDTSSQEDESIDLAAEVKEEIEDSREYAWSDIKDVTYNEYTKVLMIEFQKEKAWDEEQFRNSMAYSTFDAMTVAVQYPAYVDSVMISGYTNMIDAQGNEKLTKVYRAQVTMENATAVNWAGLMNYPDPKKAIDNNFDSTYWHTAILK